MSYPIKVGIFSDDTTYPPRLNKLGHKILEAAREDTNIIETFEFVQTGDRNAVDGTAYTGDFGEVLLARTKKNIFEIYQASVAAPATTNVPYASSDGLEMVPVAAGDALELTAGTSTSSSIAKTVGTDPRFFMEATLKIDDISDVTEIFCGFRKAEAYQADPDDYDELAAFHIGDTDDGRISIATILNGAATDMTDTTEDDIADGGEVTLRIVVDKQGNVSFSVDGSEPTVTKAFKFDDGEIVVPFIHLQTETGDPGLSLSQLKCGYY